jgi:hypothetical protein
MLMAAPDADQTLVAERNVSPVSPAATNFDFAPSQLGAAQTWTEEWTDDTLWIDETNSRDPWGIRKPRIRPKKPLSEATGANAIKNRPVIQWSYSPPKQPLRWPFMKDWLILEE